jgi:putative ABC transport system permease protein
MWLISARDLEYRLRRFVIAIAVTSIVFGMALAFDSMKRSLQDEVPRMLENIGADRWVVREGVTGPFTSGEVIPSEVAGQLRDAPGVERADPIVITRGVVTASTTYDVNVVGHSVGGLGAPPLDAGRAARAPDEVVVTKPIDVEVGEVIRMGGAKLRVVGLNDDARFNFGLPTVYLPLATAQELAFSGEELASGIAVTGTVDRLPDGLAFLSNDEVAADMQRPLKPGFDTIDFSAILSWFIAAGIIGSIVYLTAQERTRDFAVFKATGAPTRQILGGLAVQGVFLAVTSALIAIAVAHVIALGIPFPISIGGASIIQLVIVALIVGLIASLASARHALKTDPALAFGGA